MENQDHKKKKNMNMEYRNYWDWVLILSMSSVTVKSNRKMINYVHLIYVKKLWFS